MFPSEFLYQGESEAPRDNTDTYIDDALRFNDEFSGMDRINKIGSILEQTIDDFNISTNLNNALKSLNIVCDIQPQSFPAGVLRPPCLNFKGSKESSIADGSWQMKNKNFLKQSYIHSFAVIEAPGVGNEELQDFFSKLNRTIQVVGISSTKSLIDTYREVKVSLDLQSTDGSVVSRLPIPLSEILERTNPSVSPGHEFCSVARNF